MEFENACNIIPWHVSQITNWLCLRRRTTTSIELRGRACQNSILLLLYFTKEVFLYELTWKVNASRFCNIFPINVSDTGFFDIFPDTFLWNVSLICFPDMFPLHVLPWHVFQIMNWLYLRCQTKISIELRGHACQNSILSLLYILY